MEVSVCESDGACPSQFVNACSRWEAVDVMEKRRHWALQLSLLAARVEGLRARALELRVELHHRRLEVHLGGLPGPVGDGNEIG